MIGDIKAQPITGKVYFQVDLNDPSKNWSVV